MAKWQWTAIGTTVCGKRTSQELTEHSLNVFYLLHCRVSKERPAPQDQEALSGPRYINPPTEPF